MQYELSSETEVNLEKSLDAGVEAPVNVLTVNYTIEADKNNYLPEK